MSSDETVQMVARIIHGCTGDEDGAPVAARALAEAGLLAPAPLREEWGARWDDGISVMAHYLNEEEARIGAGDDPVVHRWATEWEPCDG